MAATRPAAHINSPYPYEQVLHSLAKTRPRRVLDVGAGAGALALLLAEAGFEVEACDIDPDGFQAPGVRVARADLNREPLPFADACFDAVTCCDVIEHLENPHAFFREAARVLRPNGQAVLTTPNTLNLEARLKSFFAGVSAFHRELGEHRGQVAPGEGLGHVNPIPVHELFWLGQAYGLPLVAIGADYMPRGLGLLKPLGALIRLYTRLAPARTRQRYRLEVANCHPVLFGYRLVLSFVKANVVPEVEIVPARRAWPREPHQTARAQGQL